MRERPSAFVLRRISYRVPVADHDAQTHGSQESARAAASPVNVLRLCELDILLARRYVYGCDIAAIFWRLGRTLELEKQRAALRASSPSVRGACLHLGVLSRSQRQHGDLEAGRVHVQDAYGVRRAVHEEGEQRRSITRRGEVKARDGTRPRGS